MNQSDPTERFSRYQQILDDADQALAEQFDAGVDVEQLLVERARFMDEFLSRIWRDLLGPWADQLALVAVGGYGRSELHPGSDVDILVLLPSDDGEAGKQVLPDFFNVLWDLRVDIGYSVRTVEECVEQADRDITVITSLIESRFVAGLEGLFLAMQTAIGPSRTWDSAKFFRAKWREQGARYAKYDDTAYKLEPNLKESPGGLRDIHVVSWVAKRHFGTKTQHDLVAHGFLTDSEYRQLTKGQRFLWRLRFALHLLSDRREDRLLFDHQRALADKLGYQDGPHNLAVENLMQDYYRTVMEISRLNEMLLELFQEEILLADQSTQPVSINKRFQAIKGFIEVCRPEVFRTDPCALLEIFLLLQQHPQLQGVRASTIRLIRDHCYLIDDAFRADPRARDLFMAILRQPHGVTRQLRSMNRYGVLAAYLPSFANVVGRMQYDLFHIYTVDEHSLFVIRNLRRFAIAEFDHEFPLCSQIFKEINTPEILYLAGLFHDIAKGRGGDHSELGAVDAERFCLDHGMSDSQAQCVAWLVRQHLAMSLTAQRKDISDPVIINEFAREMGDVEHLDLLYLLTVADIRATNPKLWTTWRDALLRELYLATRDALLRGLEAPPESDTQIATTQSQARLALRRSGLSDAQIDTVWRKPSPDYFLHHTAAEIAWHTAAIAQSKAADLPLVLVRPEPSRGSLAIFIYGPVQDHQFAAATAVLEQIGLTVVNARIAASADGYTMDSFLVLEQSGGYTDRPARLQEIQQSLERQLRHYKGKVVEVSLRPPRELRHFDIPVRVEFDTQAHSDYTTLRVVSADRPGLLSRIGRAFIQCQVRLHSARIATIGEQAEDVFLVTDLHNQPLDDPTQQQALQSALAECLSAP